MPKSVKAGFALEPTTIDLINKMARGSRRDKSAIVDLAVETLAQTNEFAHLKLPAPSSARYRGRSKAIAAIVSEVA